MFTASQPHRPPRLLKATRTFRQPVTQKTSHPTRPAPLAGARRRLSTLDCKLSLFPHSLSVKFNHCHSCRKTPGVYPPCLRRDLLNCPTLPPAQLGRPSLFPTNSFVLTSLADPALQPFCFDIVAKNPGGHALTATTHAENKALIHAGHLSETCTQRFRHAGAERPPRQAARSRRLSRWQAKGRFYPL